MYKKAQRAMFSLLYIRLKLFIGVQLQPFGSVVSEYCQYLSMVEKYGDAKILLS